MARAKTTRKLTGRALRSYFEAILEAESELGTTPRRRLLDLIDREVAQVRVRMSAPARRRATRVAVPPEATSASSPGALPATEPRPSPTVAQSGTEPALPPAVAPFNPYQFSAVAVMTRGGPEALLARLAQITEPANLRKFASAQHIAVSADITAVDDLRRAIVDGAAQRIADRRAAAS